METDTDHALAERARAAGGGPGHNPYVGPQPLKSSDTLYGRSRELNELGDLLIAERIVLLYSPSGAGKTSLINAGLVKRLREQHGLRVLPLLRMNLSGTDRTRDLPNRYLRAVAECLLADLTQEECERLTASAMPCLADYLDQRPRRSEDGPVDSPFELVIFDQFEEICTLDPTDIAEKEAFFAELGEALRDRNRWALIVIREDYLAEIDAFSHLLPTALASRFRLNLLSVSQAKQAIAEPAAAAGSKFSAEVVERLATDLARVMVMRPGGLQETVGISVEPVQLQVVCHRLWESRLANEPAVQDIRTGAVDEALASFYDAALKKIACQQDQEERSDDRQRLIRDWIESRLITESGTRGQIMRGDQSEKELPGDCLDALVQEHLLRAERRGDRVFIEITHDRMIAPIVKSNQAWRDHHRQLYQEQAQLWHQNERSADMLLSQGDYDKALQWREKHPGKRGEVEEDFIEASRVALAERAALEERKRKRRTRVRVVTGVAVLAVVILIGAVGFFWFQEQKARIETLNGEALALPAGQYKATLDKALKAYEVWQRIHVGGPGGRGDMDRSVGGTDPLLRHIHAAMLAGLVSAPPVQGSKLISEPEQAARAGGGQQPGASAGLSAAVRQLAFHPVRRLVAAACADGTVALWNLDRPGQPLERRKMDGQAWSVAFNADGSLLAAGGQEGVKVWAIDPKAPVAGPFVGAGLPGLRLPGVRAMAVAFNGQDRLAVGRDNGDVSVHDARNLELKPDVFHDPGRRVGIITSITFMGNDKLAFAGWHGNIWVWPWSTGGATQLAPGKTAILNFFEKRPVYEPGAPEHSGIADLVYHAGTDQLAATGWIRKKSERSDVPGHSHLAVWHTASTGPILAGREGKGGREKVSHALAFSPDGRVLAYSGSESRVLSFMASPPPPSTVSSAAPPPEPPAPAPPVRFQERLFSIAFSPHPSDGGQLVAVGDGEKISLLDWQKAGPVAARALPLAEPFDANQRSHAAMSADGSVVAVASGPKLAISYQPGNRAGDKVPAATPVRTGFGTLDALAVEPRGALVAAAGTGADAVRLFDRGGLPRGPVPLPPCTGDDARCSSLLAFRPHAGASQLAIARGTSLFIVDLAEPRHPRLLPPLQGVAGHTIKALAYSAEGSRLAVLENDNIIRVHEGGRMLKALTAPVTRVTTLAFTPDPRYLAFGTDDADIWILDLEAERWSRLDQLHDAEIKSLHFGGEKGAEFMVSADIEGRIMMWDPERDDDGVVSKTSYNRLGRTLTQKDVPLPTALSDNGELLLVGGATPRLFDLRMGSLVKQALETRAHAPRGTRP